MARDTLQSLRQQLSVANKRANGLQENFEAAARLHAQEREVLLKELDAVTKKYEACYTSLTKIGIDKKIQVEIAEMWKKRFHFLVEESRHRGNVRRKHDNIYKDISQVFQDWYIAGTDDVSKLEGALNELIAAHPEWPRQRYEPIFEELKVVPTKRPKWEIENNIIQAMSDASAKDVANAEDKKAMQHFSDEIRCGTFSRKR
jgi:hypothetical protein